MDQKLIRKWGDDYKKIHDKSCDFYYYGKNPQGPTPFNHKLSKSVDVNRKEKPKVKKPPKAPMNPLLALIMKKDADQESEEEKTPLKLIIDPIRHQQYINKAGYLQSEYLDKRKPYDGINAGKELAYLYKLKGLNVKNQAEDLKYEQFFRDKFAKHHHDNANMNSSKSKKIFKTINSVGEEINNKITKN